MFEFVLAADLHMTVGELRHTMTQHEFMEWRMFYAVRAQQQELESRSGRQ